MPRFTIAVIFKVRIRNCVTFGVSNTLIEAQTVEEVLPVLSDLCKAFTTVVEVRVFPNDPQGQFPTVSHPNPLVDLLTERKRT
jgi:hypothetical protein